jgi:hypothetical protein
MNRDFLPVADAKGTVATALSLIEDGNFEIAGDEAPFAFRWRREPGSAEAPLIHPRYFVSKTRRSDGYVNTFGPGAPVAALPVLFPLTLVAGNLLDQPALLWYGVKTTASLYVAGTALMIFLSAALFVPRRIAVLAAFAYGLGTCAWTVSSQALWQQTPNQFFLSLGTYCLLRSGERRRWAALCGLAYALAVCVRPTSAVFVLAAGSFFLLRDRRKLLVFVLAGLPLAVALAAHNQHFSGSPWQTAHTEVSLRHAVMKTGEPVLWRAPFEGALGLAVSPSRGLLVFSPFLAFALWGMWEARRGRESDALQPLAAAVVALMLVQFSWHDWWGGWSYGYRPLVDVLPALCVFLALVIERVLRHPLSRSVFAATLAWSVFVQAVGAFAYDGQSWNGEPDVDKNQQRLWSVRDSQIVYYVSHFRMGRARKLQRVRLDLERPREPGQAHLPAAP